MRLEEVRALNRRSVLVRCTGDAQHHEVAYRGTLEVHEDPVVRGLPLVQVVLGFPQMAVSSDLPCTITLDEAAVARLLAAHRRGVQELCIGGPGVPPIPASDED